MAGDGQEAPTWSSVQGKLHNGLLAGLDQMGYKTMTPVQHKVLTELPSLSSDCLVQAKTGTGKTIAFLLPAIQSLLTQPRLARGNVAILIVTPTRELALQIAKECTTVTSQLQPRLECHTAYGGTSKERELKKFINGDPKIVIATPGRLNDYLSDPCICQKFSQLRTLVLDEADQMLQAGFLVAINDILRQLPPKSRGWQGMCFSATLPKKIEGVLPKVLKPGHTTITTLDPDTEPTTDLVTQHYVSVPSISDVYVTLQLVLQAEYEMSPNSFKVIVFGTTANGVALMHALFSNIFRNSSIQVFQLQSRLSQNMRTRTVNEFKEASAGIMFASDVIGRGMDFPNVSHVIQVGVPSNGEQYVHRVGRTARAGSEGRAIIILTLRENFFLKQLKGIPITPYPRDLSPAAEATSQNVEAALASVDDSTKAKAYQAWLGFHKALTKPLGVTNDGLVQLANEHAEAMGCAEPPAIEKRVIGKMGLKGVKGLNISQGEDSGRNFASVAGRKRPERDESQSGRGNGRETSGGRGGGRGGARGGGRGGARGGTRGGARGGGRPGGVSKRTGSNAGA